MAKTGGNRDTAAHGPGAHLSLAPVLAARLPAKRQQPTATGLARSTIAEAVNDVNLKGWGDADRQ